MYSDTVKRLHAAVYNSLRVFKTHKDFLKIHLRKLCFHLHLLPLPSLNEVVFQDVQAAHHLGEDEHLVAPSLHLRQQFVDKDQLPSRLHHRLQVEVHGCGAIHLPEVLQDLLLCS